MALTRVATSIISLALILSYFTEPARAFDAAFRQSFPYEPSADWERQVLTRIPAMSPKVTDIMWGQSGSLWIEVKQDGTDWTQAGRSFCSTLEGAGKPQKKLVILTFWTNQGRGPKVRCR